MENKEFRNAFIAAVKNELKDFTQVQRNLKKSRKLEFRPKDRSLQGIVDEIKGNAYTIETLIYYYRWVRHGLKYWNNRDVQSYKDYYKNDDSESWFIKNWDKVIEYGDNKGKTHGDVIIHNTMNYYKKKCQEYNIECSEQNLNYIMTNI